MPSTFEDLLVRGALGSMGLAGGWLVLLLLAALVETASRGRVHALARVGCPQPWRPLVLLLVGSAMALPLGPARAATHDPATPREWLSVPTRPVDVAPSRPAGGVSHPPRVHVVALGDSLWAIARGRMSAAVGDGAVAGEVHRLHRLNRELLGDDPDLIHPGQRLALPGPDHPGARP